MKYAFIQLHKRIWPIRVQCRVLGVSVSGYHQHLARRREIARRRHLSDEALLVHMPYWSKDGKASFGTINAKSETVATSPAFREAWKARRCLVPADFFYEWQKPDKKTKQPYAIAM